MTVDTLQDLPASKSGDRDADTHCLLKVRRLTRRGNMEHVVCSHGYFQLVVKERRLRQSSVGAVSPKLPTDAP